GGTAAARTGQHRLFWRGGGLHPGRTARRPGPRPQVLPAGRGPGADGRGTVVSLHDLAAARAQGGGRRRESGDSQADGPTTRGRGRLATAAAGLRLRPAFGGRVAQYRETLAVASVGGPLPDCAPPSGRGGPGRRSRLFP